MVAIKIKRTKNDNFGRRGDLEYDKLAKMY